MIPFPKIHIAESALNRISNVLEDAGPLGAISEKEPEPVRLQVPPMAPNPLALGLAVDEEVQEPVPPVNVPPEEEEASNMGMLEASAFGGSPFDGALIGAASSTV